jgi:hypothetical protein
MSGDVKTVKTVQPVRGDTKADVRDRPTVTANGQVIWSTRDLLFPAGHAVRSVSRTVKK